MVSEFSVFVCDTCSLDYASFNAARKCEFDHENAIS